MSTQSTLRIFSEQTLQRADFVRLVNLALQTGELQYARIAAMSWLTTFPGDLPVTLLHARSMMGQGLVRQAVPILDNLSQTDPELIEAFELLAEARKKLDQPTVVDAEASILALGGTPTSGENLPKWAGMIRSSRQKQVERKSRPAGAKNSDTAPMEPATTQSDEVTDGIHQALAENPTSPLAAVTHLRYLQENHPIAATVQNLAQVYHQRWPRCLQFTLTLANCLMDSGATEKAVALLHQASAQDITGEVAKRIWGGENPYASLWPDQLEIGPQSPSAPQRIPIPAAVAAAMGWNQLASGGGLPAAELSRPEKPSQAPLEQTNQPPAASRPEQAQQPLQTNQPVTEPAPAYFSESLKTVQESLAKSARDIHKPELAKLDGRFPQYVLLASRKGLESVYGAEAADQVDAALRLVIPAISRRKTWNCLIYYPDAPQYSSLPALQKLQAVPPGDPWAFKLALADLDKILSSQGDMIGAVLIVGGPEVIPFHRLPNPIDDDDAEVLSDNPYSTRDENYFIPEWPVGRLPGGGKFQVDLLVQQIKTIASYHMQQSKPLPWPKRIWSEIRRMLAELGISLPRPASSFGYSAAIWRRASLSVFRPIGDPQALQVSPPISVGESDPNNENGTEPASATQVRLHGRLGYFNLHGSEEANEWFGQRDPNEPGESAEFPIALRPEDIPLNNGQKIPQIVFSEACYGANIKNRTANEAIAMRFLHAGSLAVAGSTCISYGSIATPLIAADLLGRTFWRFLGEGCVVGEAMRRAKISLAREMTRRQGYLDGEDQKTLISFVLYGDPLAQADVTGRGPKSTLRATLPQPIHTVCDRSNSSSEPTPIPDEVIAQVKTIVSQYLPGMTGARLSYAQERAGCQHAGHACPSAQFGAKAIPQQKPNRQVVVLSKKVEQSKHTHQQYARLTLDAQGKLVKLVVSR